MKPSLPLVPLLWYWKSETLYKLPKVTQLNDWWHNNLAENIFTVKSMFFHLWKREHFLSADINATSLGILQCEYQELMRGNLTSTAKVKI